MDFLLCDKNKSPFFYERGGWGRGSVINLVALDKMSKFLTMSVFPQGQNKDNNN